MEKWENAAAVYNAAALCAVGGEKAVSNELKKLGLAVTDSGFGKVRFRAGIAGLYRSLMGLRAADRVLLEAAAFNAADFDSLFNETYNIHWEQLVPEQLGFRVTKVRSNRSQLKAETSIQSVVHKAAAQRLCEAYGLERLSETGDTAEVRVHVEKDTVSLLLDLCGEPLYKRGYRKEGGIAPLRETTAAALLLLSGWKRKYPLYDPFCGSGSILTEALMYAWDMAPGLGRNFALSSLLIASSEIEKTVRDELRSRINFDRMIRLAGSDEDPKAVALAASNIKRLREIHPAVPDITAAPVRLEPLPIGKTRNVFPDSEPGFIVTNPPYGKRLGDQAASERIYGEMAALGRHFPHWKLAVITDHPGFESFFGSKADSCREIKSGPIPTFFYQYEEL